MAQIKVADVSRWQGSINWDELKNHIDAVVIKATGADGGLYTDGRFQRNRDEARRLGIPRWFYHFKGGGSARQQAEYFVGAIGGLQEGEGLVLDDENEGSVNVGFDGEFVDRVKELTGLNVVLYANQARFSGANLQPIKDRNIGAWVAKYGVNNGTIEGAGEAPGAGVLSVIMWQYTSAARVPGVSENSVDMNVFYGDVGQFKAYGAKNNVPAPSPAPQPSPNTGGGTYTVQRGDTLSGIGGKLGIDWHLIQQWNGIANPNVIFPGQILKVYGGAAGNTTPTDVGSYRVVSGDTLIGIGQKTGKDWREIAQINGLGSPYTIYPNQVLKLPGSGGTVGPAAPRTYTVQSGDSLSVIGQKVGVDWQRIAEINGIKPPYTIYPNQVLRLE